MSTQPRSAGRSGWVTFAAVILFAVAFARLVSGINLLDGGDQVNDLTNSLYGDDLWAWGIWDLCISAVALVAGFSLLAGGGFGRVMGYIWGVLVICQSLLLIGVAPWYSAAAIALGSLVIYGLASTSDAEGI